MRVLLIKTSSMGDLLHTFPALTDAAQAIPDIQFDWVVEKSFAELPHWHPHVKTVIPVALRHWRKNIFASLAGHEWKQTRQQLRQHSYDLVLDAQGLVKSALLGLFTQGERAGLDFHSARETLASLFYKRRYTVNFYQHAIKRMRSLFSQALGYTLPDSAPDFSLRQTFLSTRASPEKYVVFLHGTTWTSKQWPEEYWKALVQLAEQAGYRIKINSSNPEEAARVQHIAQASSAVDIFSRLSLNEMGTLLAHAKAVIAVDTGLGHLAAALDVPTISLYGSTNPIYTGAVGKYSTHLAADFDCAPCLRRTCLYQQSLTVLPACYTTLTPAKVWQAVMKWVK